MNLAVLVSRHDKHPIAHFVYNGSRHSASTVKNLPARLNGVSIEPDVTEENIQARIRGNIMMALSNKFGYLVLSTGNKSELAVGYCTLYGDMSGGLAAISDVPKTTVYH